MLFNSINSLSSWQCPTQKNYRWESYHIRDLQVSQTDIPRVIAIDNFTLLVKKSFVLHPGAFEQFFEPLWLPQGRFYVLSGIVQSRSDTTPGLSCLESLSDSVAVYLGFYKGRQRVVFALVQFTEWIDVFEKKVKCFCSSLCGISIEFVLFFIIEQ